MLYFAYGSNMNHEQMKKRCPGSNFIGLAKLNGYKFVYDGISQTRGGAVANMVESPEDIVWGGIFDVPNIDCLDRFEGAPKIYQRKSVNVQDESGKVYNDILVYLRNGEKIGEPSKEYRELVITGAKNCHLPKNYIDFNL
jgi:hypothetical protein